MNCDKLSYATKQQFVIYFLVSFQFHRLFFQKNLFHIFLKLFYVLEATYQDAFHSSPLQHMSSILSSNQGKKDISMMRDLLPGSHQKFYYISNKFWTSFKLKWSINL